jgi:hypothetical protein
MLAPERSDTVDVHSVKIDEVFNSTFELFGRRIGEMLAIGAIVLGGSFFLSFAQNIVGAIVQAIDPVIGGILSMILSVVGMFAGYYLSLGTINAVLAIARNDVSPIGKMIISPVLVLKLMAGLFLLALPCLPILAIGLLPLAVIQGDEGAMISIVLVGVIGFALFSVLLACLWPWPILLVDNHPGIISPIRNSLKISMANKGMSLIILVSFMVLPLVGCMLLCVGSIVTQPLKVTLSCVAYLMITGQWESIRNAGRNYVPYAGHQPAPTSPG